jgi:probable rRNA maturation factor
LPRPLPADLEAIDFILVDRRTISRVHAEFMSDASPTDVITFPYGEILICPAVAREQAREHELELEDEVLLYALHGLLHLIGYNDLIPEDMQAMQRAQTRLLRRLRAAER